MEEGGVEVRRVEEKGEEGEEESGATLVLPPIDDVMKPTRTCTRRGKNTYRTEYISYPHLYAFKSGPLIVRGLLKTTTLIPCPWITATLCYHRLIGWPPRVAVNEAPLPGFHLGGHLTPLASISPLWECFYIQRV